MNIGKTYKVAMNIGNAQQQKETYKVAKMFAIEYNQEDEYYAIRADALEEGMEKGKIELYFTKLKYSVKEIADEMNLGEDVVSATLNSLGLI